MVLEAIAAATGPWDITKCGITVSRTLSMPGYNNVRAEASMEASTGGQGLANSTAVASALDAMRSACLAEVDRLIAENAKRLAMTVPFPPAEELFHLWGQEVATQVVETARRRNAQYIEWSRGLNQHSYPEPDEGDERQDDERE